jgi:hypothetical protein
MRLPFTLEDADEQMKRLVEQDDDRLQEQAQRSEAEERAGLAPWRMRAHRLARRERARRRATDDQEGEGR